jgi:hypothetical protein
MAHHEIHARIKKVPELKELIDRAVTVTAGVTPGAVTFHVPLSCETRDISTTVGGAGVVGKGGLGIGWSVCVASGVTWHASVLCTPE